MRACPRAAAWANAVVLIWMGILVDGKRLGAPVPHYFTHSVRARPSPHAPPWLSSFPALSLRGGHGTSEMLAGGEKDGAAPPGWGQTCSWCSNQAPKSAAGSTGKKLLRCSWCREAFYCGKECQLAHWPSHKQGCPPTAAPPPDPPIDEARGNPDQPLRIRRRIAAAEEIQDQTAGHKGKLPSDWKICRSCRLPVIIEWMECPGCERPISELDGENAEGLMPEQSDIVQHTKILGDVQADLFEGVCA